MDKNGLGMIIKCKAVKGEINKQKNSKE